MNRTCSGLKSSELAHFFDGAALDGAGVDYRGADVAVTQQLLDRAHIVVRPQQVARKAVPERVAGDPFGNLRHSNGFTQSLLQLGFVHVIAPPLILLRNKRQGLRREEPLPNELL